MSTLPKTDSPWNGLDLSSIPSSTLSEALLIAVMKEAKKRKPKKRYDCDICGKSFSKAYNRKAHYRKHSGERPFKCKVAGCGKDFSWRSSLKSHEASHRDGALSTIPEKSDGGFTSDDSLSTSTHSNHEDHLDSLLNLDFATGAYTTPNATTTTTTTAAAAAATEPPNSALTVDLDLTIPADPAPDAAPLAPAPTTASTRGPRPALAPLFSPRTTEWGSGAPAGALCFQPVSATVRWGQSPGVGSALGMGSPKWFGEGPVDPARTPRWMRDVCALVGAGATGAPAAPEPLTDA